MTTPEMRRCRKCSLCEVNEKTGRWTCIECEEDIHDIKDEDCPLEADY